jgi:hypothetical protein
MADYRLTQTGRQVQALLDHIPEIDTNLTNETNRAEGAEQTNAQAIAQHVGNNGIHVTPEQKVAWTSKYDKPGTGIPLTDLAAAVQAAIAAANSAYQKPITGIPATDMTEAVQQAIAKALSAYQKPGTGIPLSDLAEAVQSAIAKANSAYQKPNTGIPQSDMDASVQAKLNAAGSADQAIADERSAREAADLAINTLLNTKLNSEQVGTLITAALANYSTRSDVAAAITDALTVYYTKQAVDTLLAQKQNTLTFDQTPTQNSQNPVTSHGILTAIAAAVSGLLNQTQVQALINAALQSYSTTTEVANAISTALAGYTTTSQVGTMISTAINSALQAYATKEYVSSQVQEYAGTFRGTYDSLAELIATTGNHHNDYAWVKVTDSDGDNDFDRYKYNGSEWLFEYRLNNTHFTSADLAAIHSGITAAKVASYDSHLANTTVHITSAERQTWNAKQNAITDGAQIGLGFGVSSEAATVQARTATISSFILLKNMPVSIRFNNAINVDSATLNVSSTGAKPLFIQGAALQGGLVKAGCTITVIYDGTNYNIVCIEGLERPSSQSDLFVDMGLPSGLLWAIANIDMTTQSGFAEVDGKPSPFKYEGTFFSWGNTEGHNPISDSAFSYDWGTGNDGPYAQTPGAALTANAGLSYDAARAILGAPWRDPSTEDFAELFANIDYVQADGETVIDASQANKLVTVNGIVGIYLKSKINGRLLFFPCSGYGVGQSWNLRGSYGNYWSRSLYSQTNGRSLYFYSGGVDPQSNSNRFHGFARRAVQ